VANLGFFATSFAVRSSRPARERAGVQRERGSILRDRQILAFLAICCLHWIACAPFNGMFSIHLQSLGFAPPVIGLAAAVSVTSELAGMWIYPRVAARWSRHQILVTCFLVSAVRWLAVGVTTSGAAMVLLQTLHGMTFGLFYVTAVQLVDARVSREARTTGQTLFVATTFGLGGLVGYGGGGIAYDAIGGPALFCVAAVLEIAAALATLRLARP
jgi:MFS transporter, PPP family, 3-phenylpropionic acid transporter